MFEERKEKAQTPWEKRRNACKKSNPSLTKAITPKLNRLREQKRWFIQYQKSATELERLGRTLRACEWQDVYDRVGKKQKKEKENEI